MIAHDRPLAGRVFGLALAVGAGAVIACSSAAPAGATGDDSSARGASASSSESGRTGADGAPTRRDSREPARSRSRTDTRFETSDEASDENAADESGGGASVEDAALASEVDDEVVSASEVKVLSDTRAVRRVEDAPIPDQPASLAPGIWTLLGSHRRQSDNTTAAVPEPGIVDSTGASETTAAASDPVENAAGLYTGKPSFIHNVVTAGLYVLQAVLKPFGGLLAFTSLKVPFFTDGVPPFFLTAGLDVERSEFDGMTVWTLTPRDNATDKTVVALHGGAYMATASIFHWWTYADMARDTRATVIVPLQTLVPAGGTAATEVPRTADFITKVVDERGADNVSVFGDSAGGGLALAAMQELVRRNSRVPARLVLLAPWLDVSMSDPRSDRIRDPLLDRRNLVRAGVRWAGATGPADPLASPLFGSLAGLPRTYVYSSSLDMLTVDSLRLRDRVLTEQIPSVTFRLRHGLIHDWFTFPFLPDARADRAGVYRDLLGTGDRRVRRPHAV